MNKTCPFIEKHYCDIWLDYDITKDELELANELLHSNWIEITNLYDRIDRLEKYIKSIGGTVPTDY